MRWALACALLAACGGACVDGGVPPRPSATINAVDGGPEPIQLATGSHCGEVRLVVRGGNVYWTERGSGLVKSVPTAGGPTTVIAHGQASPGAIAVDESSIFWVAGDAVMRRAIKGGAATVFIKATSVPEVLGGENDINALLADRGELFFSRFTMTLKTPVEGGAPMKIGRSPDADMGKAAAFAIDATHLYQTELDHRAVSRERLDGMQEGLLEGGATAMLAPDRIAVSQGELLEDAIGVVDGRVIWANGITIHGKAVEALEKENSVALTSSLGGNAITGFVVSGGAIYFGEAVENAVERAPLDTGVATVIAKNQWNPRQLAADGDAIYWHTDDCKVMKLPK